MAGDDIPHVLVHKHFQAKFYLCSHLPGEEKQTIPRAYLHEVRMCVSSGPEIPLQGSYPTEAVAHAHTQSHLYGHSLQHCLL